MALATFELLTMFCSFSVPIVGVDVSLECTCYVQHAKMKVQCTGRHITEIPAPLPVHANKLYECFTSRGIYQTPFESRRLVKKNWASKRSFLKQSLCSSTCYSYKTKQTESHLFHHVTSTNVSHCFIPFRQIDKEHFAGCGARWSLQRHGTTSISVRT